MFASFITHTGRVDSVQLSMEDHHARPTGLLLTASQDGTVKYWDLKRYDRECNFKTGAVYSASRFRDNFDVFIFSTWTPRAF